MTEQVKELIRRFENGIMEYYSCFKDSNQSFTELDDNYKEIYRIDFIANDDFINEILEYEKNDSTKLFITRWENINNEMVFWIEKSDYVYKKMNKIFIVNSDMIYDYYDNTNKAEELLNKIKSDKKFKQINNDFWFTSQDLNSINSKYKDFNYNFDLLDIVESETDFHDFRLCGDDDKIRYKISEYLLVNKWSNIGKRNLIKFLKSIGITEVFKI